MIAVLLAAACSSAPAEDLADRWWYLENEQLYALLETTDEETPSGRVWLRVSYPVEVVPTIGVPAGSWAFEPPDVYTITVAGYEYRGHASDADEWGCVTVRWLWISDYACPVDVLGVEAWL